MSIEALSYVLNVTVGDSTRKLILLGYANHAHADGTAAWPSVETIAAYADCTARTVQRHLRALVDEGFMREGDQGLISHLRADRRPTVYNVAMSEEQRLGWATEQRGDIETPRDESDRGDTAERRGDAGDADGVTSVTERGDAAMSPEPSLNRPEEPSKEPSGRAGRGTRLPDDWEPDETLKQWFREQSFANLVNPVVETEKFKDYWRARPGQGGVKLDWPATWRNWMRNGADRRASQASPHRPTVGAEQRDHYASQF